MRRCICRLQVLLLLDVVIAGGCTSCVPPEEPPFTFKARAETQSQGDISVSAVVLNEEESKEVFRASLAKHQIQPIWLEIENRGTAHYTLMLLSIDRNYFSPSEAAWRSQRFGERRTGAKMQYFYEQHIPVLIPPREIVSGFVYTNLDPDAKAFTMQLLGKVGGTHSINFVLPVPSFKADFMRDQLQTFLAQMKVRNLDQDSFRAYIESLPCCVKGSDRKTPGDPLNLVIVGEGRHVITTLIGRGWNFTEPLTLSNAWQTAMSSLFGFRYRTSSVSLLFLFDRPQDAAFQKTRRDVDERNHLRLWRAPVDCEDMSVWVGQISRDIGVRLSNKTIVTHKIDPVVDEARFYLALDLLASGYVQRFAFVKGVGSASLNLPQYNYTRDPYFTDGLRLVLFLTDQPVAFDNIEWLEWETPPRIRRAKGVTNE